MGEGPLPDSDRRVEVRPVCPGIALRDVVQGYGQKLVLRGISAEFGPGVTAVLGRNGAGKSTLVRALVGAEKPTSGQVVLHRDGAEHSPIPHELIGWLPQRFGFPRSMRASDFVSYAAWLKGLDKSQARHAAEESLRWVDIDADADVRMSRLSGGTVRRVGLAAAMAHRPSVVVLDEPTAGLDPIQRARFHAHIESVAETASVVLATHLLEDVAAVAAEVIVIDGGQVIWSGAREKLSGQRDDGNLHDQVGALREKLADLLGERF